MKEIIQGFYQKKHFWTRLILVIAAVILMGFALSWLLLVDLGTDPCTLLNQTISTRLGISIGNWQALFNTVLLIFVIIFGGRNLGFGTLANMFLVGYSIDFFSWIWAKVLPADLFTSMGVRIAVLIPALVLFILAASFYMDVDMGTAPYDAVSFIISTPPAERFVPCDPHRLRLRCHRDRRSARRKTRHCHRADGYYPRSGH